MHLFISIFALILMYTTNSWGDTGSKTDTNTKIDTLIQSCLHEVVRDPICDAVIELQQIGDDAIEAVKLYVNMTPSQYTALTIANGIIAKRVRYKMKSPYIKQAFQTLDIQEKKVMFIIDVNF